MIFAPLELRTLIALAISTAPLEAPYTSHTDTQFEGAAPVVIPRGFLVQV